MDCRLAKNECLNSLTNFGNETHQDGGICSQRPRLIHFQRRRLQVCTQNNTLCNRRKEFELIHLDQIFVDAMSDLSKEQEQAIARSTMYLFAALLTIVMVSIAGLFLSAELEQQAQSKTETSLQLSSQNQVAPRSERPWTRWSRHESAMLPVKIPV